MKKLYLLFIVSIILYCPSTQVKDDGYTYVYKIYGVSVEDAELNAKRDIIAKGLGELVEGSSQAIDGELKEKIVNSSTEGYVIGYEQLAKRNKDGGVEIDARGKVDKGSLQGLIDRYKTLGKPSFMVLIDETIAGNKSTTGESVTENAIVKNFKNFDFKDKDTFLRRIQKEGKIAAYGDKNAEQKAIQIAADMEIQLLMIGRTEVKNNGAIKDIPGAEGMNSMQAILRYKVVNTGTASIIAADNANGAAAHVDPETGAQQAIEKAVAKSYGTITDQMTTKWKPGMTIRFVADGIAYEDFRDSLETIRKIKGVNATNVKSTAPNIVVEVEAMFNGVKLYDKMLDRKGDFGFKFKQKQVDPNVVWIVVQK